MLCPGALSIYEIVYRIRAKARRLDTEQGGCNDYPHADFSIGAIKERQLLHVDDAPLEGDNDGLRAVGHATATKRMASS